MESKVGLFAAAAAFGGHRAGWVFKHGSQGLGYYADVGSFAAAQAATEEDFLRKYAVATAGPSNEAAANVASTLHTDQHSQNEPTLDPDAPIVAALASHSDALDEVDRATAQLERELAAVGRVAASSRHQAEKLEVRLTDQLHQLNAMLDDCVSSDGRHQVKLRISRLRGLGARLLKISQAR